MWSWKGSIQQARPTKATDTVIILLGLTFKPRVHFGTIRRFSGAVTKVPRFKGILRDGSCNARRMSVEERKRWSEIEEDQ